MFLSSLNVLFEIEQDIGSHAGSNSAYLWTSGSTMPSHLVKGLPLFRDGKTIDSAVANPMNLVTKRVPHFLPELVIQSNGWLHCLLVLPDIRKSLTSNHTPDCHDRSDECPTCLTLPGNPSSQSTTRFENIRTANVDLFLQSCKNCLRSSKVVHIIRKCQFENLFENAFPISHHPLLLSDALDLFLI